MLNEHGGDRVAADFVSNRWSYRFLSIPYFSDTSSHRVVNSRKMEYRLKAVIEECGLAKSGLMWAIDED